MAKTRRTPPSPATKQLPTKTAMKRAEEERSGELSVLVELHMPPDARVLSIMTKEWLTAQLKSAKPVKSGPGCWQHRSDITENAVHNSLRIKKVRRRAKNLGNHRLIADNLLPSFKPFAGYLWREVHLAFNASPTTNTKFVTLDAASSAAKSSKSASVYLYQIAAWLHTKPSDRLKSRLLDYQCSHLCNNPHCFNPDHIFLESALDNQARESCRRAETFGTAEGDAVACAHGGKDRPYCVRFKTETKMTFIDEGRMPKTGGSAGATKVGMGRVLRKGSK